MISRIFDLTNCLQPFRYPRHEFGGLLRFALIHIVKILLQLQSLIVAFKPLHKLQRIRKRYKSATVCFCPIGGLVIEYVL